MYKENKRIGEIVQDMKLSRETIWRIKNRAINKIMKDADISKLECTDFCHNYYEDEEKFKIVNILEMNP